MVRFFLSISLSLFLLFTVEAFAAQPSEIWNRIFKRNKSEKVEKPTLTSKAKPTIEDDKNINGRPENNIIVRNAEKSVVVIIDKLAKKLHVYATDGENTRLVESFDALFGERNGNKLSQGDKRTPEGVYFVTSYKDMDELKTQFGKDAEIYGSGAFPINYPNAVDKLNLKTGGGIWIHGIGVDNKTVTRGCVALQNSDLDKLKKYININTPVLILEKSISSLPMSKEKFIETVATLAGDYLLKNKVGEIYNRPNYRVFIQNESNFVIDFNLLACKHNNYINENIKLFIVQDDKALYDNVSESYIVVTDEVRSLPIDSDEVEQSIKKFLNGWVTAWNKQDINEYKAFYSENSSFYGTTFNEYIDMKRKLFAQKDNIAVQISQLKMSIDNGKISVTAYQDYKSSELKSKGVKRVVIAGCPNNYKIIHESWSSK